MLGEELRRRRPSPVGISRDAPISRRVRPRHRERAAAAAGAACNRRRPTIEALGPGPRAATTAGGERQMATGHGTGWGSGLGEPVAAGRRRDPLDQPGEPRPASGAAAAWPPRAPAPTPRPRPRRRAGRSSPSVQIAPGDEYVLADIEGSGRDPAHLADADRRLAQPDPAHVLGRRPAAGGRVPGRRLLRLRLGRVRPGRRRSPCASTRAGRSTATGRCRSSGGPASRSPTRASRSASLYYQIDYSLCDVPDDAARFCAQFRRVNPLPQGRRRHDPRRRAGPRPVRRHVLRVGRQQLAAGGARAR